MNKKVAYLLASLTIFSFIFFVVTRRTTEFQLDVFNQFIPLLSKAFLNTLLVSVLALLGSIVLGFIFYLLSISKYKYFNALIDLFTEIIYGTPLLVMVVITAFLIGPAFNTYNRNALGIAALIFYMAPYMKNVFKSSIASVSSEQYLAMDLFQFTTYQRYRYIIIPQVIRVLMPPLMNNFSMIIKGSALLNVLSFNELYYAIAVIQSKTYAFVEGYIILWALYLLITVPISLLSKYVEKRWAL
ncbi:MAG TPA: ABC transporter permease subunit [Acholeplasma sp.]|nr:ABC transporter permease subunit [Acholeplasma sp.]